MPGPIEILHYDIRAVSGVTRAACGFENNGGVLTGYNTTINRNFVGCPQCREKIKILAEFGGDAISDPNRLPQAPTREWFKELVKEALVEDDSEHDEEYREWHTEIMLDALAKNEEKYSLLRRRQTRESVQEAVREGKFKFDTDELVTAVNKGLELHMEAAKKVLAHDFMNAPNVRQLLTNQAQVGSELAFDENKEDLADLIREVLEDVLKDNPMQFVQNVYATDENMTSTEVWRATRDLLNGETPEPAPVPINFNQLTHQELGEWASVNDLVREWQYDTNMVRRLLAMRLANGELVQLSPFPGKRAKR